MTRNLEDAKRDAINEILKQLGRWPHGWTIDRLVQIRNQICELLAANRNQVSRRWNVRIAALARIVQQERRQAERVDDYNRNQRAKAKS